MLIANCLLKAKVNLTIVTVFHTKRVEFENRDKKSKSQAKHLHPTSRYLFEITGLLSDLGNFNQSLDIFAHRLSCVVLYLVQINLRDMVNIFLNISP